MRHLKTSQLGFGGAVLVFTLIALLLLTMAWAISAWSIGSDIEMGKHGWIALGLGTFFSLLIGCGLMALMFYSSRSGHDDAADPFRHKERQRVDRAQNDNDR
ncbi:MAG: hypothetical protein WBB98_15140 [Xanthobacteraceae bacterium]